MPSATAEKSQVAFTLVELLVVITIIVVLISLLVPALDKAVYRAELLQCGAGRLRVLGSGVTQYAMDNRRWYPDRGMSARTGDPSQFSITATTIYSPLVDLDMRPFLRPYVNINNTMQCNFPGTIELDNRPPEESDILLESSYTLWWGWQYKYENQVFQGMFRLGDRFTSLDYAPNHPGFAVRAFNILAGDLDGTYPMASFTAHPDRDPAMLGVVRFDPGVFIGRFASSWYRSTGTEDVNRGSVDHNYVFADGSSQLYIDIPNMKNIPGSNPPQPTPTSRMHPKMARVPTNYDRRNNRGINSDMFHIPID
jgi:type II secretory pathway pseudopilin PulG